MACSSARRRESSPQHEGAASPEYEWALPQPLRISPFPATLSLSGTHCSTPSQRPSACCAPAPGGWSAGRLSGQAGGSAEAGTEGTCLGGDATWCAHGRAPPRTEGWQSIAASGFTFQWPHREGPLLTRRCRPQRFSADTEVSSAKDLC